MKQFLTHPLFIVFLGLYAVGATAFSIERQSAVRSLQVTIEANHAGNQTCWDNIALMQEIGAEQSEIIILQDSVPMTDQLRAQITAHKTSVQQRLLNYIVAVNQLKSAEK